MAISIIVQIAGTTLRQGSNIQNVLIVTEGQAITVGTQELFSFYHSRKNRTIELPYVGVLDGEIASVEILSLTKPNKNHLINGTSINLSLENGINEIIAIEGEYEDPQ